MKSLDHYWDSIYFISILLLPLSVLFYLISRVRQFLYVTKIIKSFKASVPVVVVGNISVGGTGKTPLIIELVKQLQSKGKKPAVISRGYGGRASSWPQVVGDNTSAKQVGDEPQLIFQQTRCPVVVGPNRKDDIEYLLKSFECDVILSDDGMQHYALQRDIEICVIDAEKKFGNGLFIPAGPMRESQSRLKSVDLVLYNGGNNNCRSFNMKPLQCVPVVNETLDDNLRNKALPKVDLEFFSDKTVHAVVAIGNPQRFFNMLKDYNITIIPHVFNDHHAYQSSDLVFDDDLHVLMTEKDAVKCVGMNLPNHWSVPVEILLNENAQTKVNEIFNSLFKI